MDIEHSKAGEGEKTTPTGLAMEAPSAAVGAEPTVEEPCVKFVCCGEAANGSVHFRV